MLSKLAALKSSLKGHLATDQTTKYLYATDASVYKELPLAIATPQNIEDLNTLIKFASEHNTSLIPRTAGTSLAGQVVGKGIVVDISTSFNHILEINTQEKWVRVEPSVVLDELNAILENDGLFFGPETSTANRCMIGGMVGNNACGAHSLIYGSTRDHTLEIKALLSDGSQVEFKSLSKDEFHNKCKGDSLENKIYQNIQEILSVKDHQAEIRKEFPHPEIERRNTGYAIDLLLESNPFTDNKEDFNFCKLIAGSEGTLAFITEIKLNLVDLPPKHKALVCIHFEDVKAALYGNIEVLKHQPQSIELMDKLILECTKESLQFKKNCFFIEGDPGAILITEFAGESKEIIEEKIIQLEKDLRHKKLGYHFPIIWGADMARVWQLRKAGVGLLSNVPGDKKPVAVVEDTAVHPDDLPDFIADFDHLLTKYDLDCVYHAHIATGELHLRPALNLKDSKDVELFHTIALATAHLVKKYRGSLSGEHGDGRLRAEFISLMLGEENYTHLKSIKNVWDPQNIFNPNKIVDAPKMNTFLRYEPNHHTPEIETIFDFSKDHGYIQSIEKCNGSGDCRKSHLIGGTMCPSFMATKDEATTTRARANILREYLTNAPPKERFVQKEIYDILDLCLSCKGCKSECPSGVDITKYKAEYLQYYYDKKGIPLRTSVIAYISSINKLGMIAPHIFNFFIENPITSNLFKRFLGFAPKRSIPKLYKYTLTAWSKSYQQIISPEYDNGTVNLFIDEFSEYNDVEIGIKAVKLLNKLGYTVKFPSHLESGRTFLSKGLIRKAKSIAEINIQRLYKVVSEDEPLIGIEPSGILSFKDEYIDLTSGVLKERAIALAKNCLLFDEFILKEVEKGNISPYQFTNKVENIKLHAHCHQKSLTSIEPTEKLLSLPKNYNVDTIKSGCCGMAGSFGYEKEHYDLSMKVGELVLFPEVRKSEQSIISAPGTSCRHQIKDGTGRIALHPIEVLYEAINF